MSLFKDAENTQAYLKAGILGFMGSGKTHTATLIAIGLHQLTKSKGPIFFIDTETGSDWVKPMLDEQGIKMKQAKTRSFSDLLALLKEVQAAKAICIVDSLTHFWRELCDSYQKKRNKSYLTMQDWGYLKTTWAQFTDLYVNSNAHIILCGRAGYEYETEENEDTGKKEMFKSGIKMKAETETGYEPSILVLMERELDVKTKETTRHAYVLKDRSRRLDGKHFYNPTFKDFLPHIQFLNLGGEQLGVDTSRTSEAMIDTNKDAAYRKRQVDITLDEIETILLQFYPTRTKEDVQAKLKILQDTFGTAAWEAIKAKRLEELQMGFRVIVDILDPKRMSRPEASQEEPVEDDLPESLGGKSDTKETNVTQ